MKTATVRQLRNDYRALLRWVEAGHEIRVSRRGRVIARLVPERGPAPGRTDWSASAAGRMDKTHLPLLSAGASARLLSESRGEY
jgi:prevent-host-death family protein